MVCLAEKKKERERKRKIEESLMALHKRLGHPSSEVLFEVCKKYSLVENFPQLRDLCNVVRKCEPCLLGKAKRIAHPAKSPNVSSTPGERIHYDTFGPSREASKSGSRYAGVMTDAFSMFSWVEFAAHKNQLPGKMVPILRQLARNFAMFKKFRTDNAPELKQMWDVCCEIGIMVEKTVPGESAQNASAERAIGILAEKARVLLLESGASRGFWTEAFRYASLLNNILVHRRLGWRSPTEVLFGTQVCLDLFKPFGCAAYVTLPKGTNKLASRAVKCINLGPDSMAKGWRVWDPQANRVFVRWNIRFNETEFPWQVKPVGGVVWDDDGEDKPVVSPPIPAVPALPHVPAVPALPALSVLPSLPAPPAPPAVAAPVLSVDHAGPMPDLDGDSDDENDEQVEEKEDAPEVPAAVPEPALVAAPRYQLRENRGVPALRLGSADEEAFSANVMPKTHSLGQVDTKYPNAVMEEAPKSRQAALASPNAKYWLQAEQEELARFRKYNALEPVDVLPPGAHIIGGHFVYALKTNADFVITKFKARYVADGNRQEPMVDYKRTKSDVADQKSLRLCLLAGSISKGHFFQVDVDSAFLQSDPLEEIIYLRAPPGYPTKFARAHKPIYGLAQSGRCFRKTLHRSLVDRCGLTASTVDPGVYYELVGGKLNMMCVVHVDDFIGFGLTAERKQLFGQALSACHDITWTENPTNILSHNIRVDANGYVFLSNEKYITACMAKYDIPMSHPTRLAASTPKPILPPSEDELKLSTPELVQKMQQLVGGGIYACTQIRFDVLYMFVHLARYSTVAVPRFIEILYKLYQYLYSTRSCSIVYGGNINSGIKLIGCSDASFPVVPDAKAQLGYIIFVLVGDHYNIISFNSKKIDHVCTSVTDAEISAGSACAVSLVAIRLCLIELGILPKNNKAILYLDNQATVTIAQDGGYYPKLAHINRKHKYIMECVEQNVLEVLWVPGTKNPADSLTKPLGRTALDMLRASYFAQ